jgi:hypothetical protein
METEYEEIDKLEQEYILNGGVPCTICHEVVPTEKKDSIALPSYFLLLLYG